MKNELETIPVMILAGGSPVNINGTLMPKASIKVNGLPLLAHTVEKYFRSGFRRFIVCVGEGYQQIQSDWNSLGALASHEHLKQATVQFVFTGGQNATASRLLQGLEYVKDEPETIAVSYVDTVSDVDLLEVLEFHRKYGVAVTMTAVNLPTRFKVIGYNALSPFVRGFSAKPIIENNLVSGGYYFVQRVALEQDSDRQSSRLSFENDLLPRWAMKGQAVFFQHLGFWQFVDSSRDVQAAETVLLRS